jgi:hypothetical protein
MNKHSTAGPRQHRITWLSHFFTIVAHPGPWVLQLPMVSETMEAVLNAPQRKIICWRQLNLPDLFLTIQVSPNVFSPLSLLNAARQFQWVYSLSSEASEIAVKTIVHLFICGKKYTSSIKKREGSTDAATTTKKQRPTNSQS